MVGYMRRFAPAFIEGVEEVKKMEKINTLGYGILLDQIIMFIEQSHNVLRFNDIPQEAIADRSDRAKKWCMRQLGMFQLK